LGAGWGENGRGWEGQGDRGTTVTHLANGNPKGPQKCISHHRGVPNGRLQPLRASGGVSIVRQGGKG
jgi:hypothetical protein